MGQYMLDVLNAMKNDPKGRGPMFAPGSPLVELQQQGIYQPDQAYEYVTEKADAKADAESAARIADSKIVNPPAPVVEPVAPPSVSTTTPLVDVFTEQGAGRGRPPDVGTFPGGMIPTPGKRPKAMERIDEE